MSGIGDFFAEQFSVRPTDPDCSHANAIVFDLDVGLTQAGRVAQQIYDLVVHPAAEVDDEAVAATARALLAHLAQLGNYLDALELITRPLRSMR